MMSVMGKASSPAPSPGSEISAHCCCSERCAIQPLKLHMCVYVCVGMRRAGCSQAAHCSRNLRMLTKPRIDVYLVFNYTYLTRDQKCGPGSLLLPGYT